MIASYFGHLAIVGLLSSKGTDPNSRNATWTALSLAVDQLDVVCPSAGVCSLVHSSDRVSQQGYVERRGDRIRQMRFRGPRPVA